MVVMISAWMGYEPMMRGDLGDELRGAGVNDRKLRVKGQINGYG